ncbi:MAG: LamG domain-containing protein [Armatimonadota bacterium]
MKNNQPIPMTAGTKLPVQLPDGCVLAPDFESRSSAKLPDGGGTSTIAVSGAAAVTLLYGSGYLFDGSDDLLNCGHSASIGNLPQLSIEMWTLRTGQGEGNAGMYFSKGTKITSSCSTSATRIDFRRGFSTTAGYWYSAASIVTTRWQHIVITYDCTSADNNPAIYIDGAASVVTRNTQPVGTRTDDTSDDLYIGNKADASATFSGKFGAFRLYNRILSPAEVKTLFRQSAHRYGIGG